MEKEKLFMNEGGDINTATLILPTWSSCSYILETQSNDLNYGSEQLSSSYFNPNLETPLDQNDPFESALSSIVSSPAVSTANPVNNGGGGDFMIRELIGRLGNISSSSNNNNNNNNTSNVNSTNTSCYSTPLNSPPKLNLSMMDSQIRGNLPIIGNHLPSHPGLGSFAADPGFAERAARFSCFGGRNYGGLNGQFVSNETELSQRLMPKLEPCKPATVSSNQTMRGFTGSQLNVQDNKSPDKKFGGLSSSSAPENAENGDSREESTVSEQIPSGELNLKSQNNGNARKRKAIPRGKVKETPSPSLSATESKVAVENDESNAKRSKIEESKGSETDAAKAKEEPNNGNQKQNKENSKPEPPKDYIHVRARRGQATDSHSLAERVRREKISERMKFLQDLVPGCNKVTGKAVMLDEIINYVQSLQRQVEFLSMKLATVNPRMDFNMEAFLSKDIFQSRATLPHNLYPLDASARAFPLGYQQQQPLHGSMPNNNTAATQFCMSSVNTGGSQRNPGTQMQLPPVDGLGDANAIPQGAFWEDDLQSVVQMGFGQNQPQSFHGSLTAAQ